MSKHRNKSAKTAQAPNSNSFLNPQMLKMLGVNDADMAKISGMVNSMGQEGFDMNSLNSMFSGGGQGQSNGTSPQQDMSGMAGLLNMFGGGQGTGGMPNMGNMAGLMSMLGGGLGGNNNGGNSNAGQFDMNSLSGLMGMLGGLGGNNMAGGNDQNYNMQNQNININNNDINNNQEVLNNNQSTNKMNKGINSSMNNLSMENLAEMLSSFPVNDTKTTSNNSNKSKLDDIDLENDPNIVMLNSIKKFVNTDRGRFLDKVIEMYKNGDINY